MHITNVETKLATPPSHTPQLDVLVCEAEAGRGTKRSLKCLHLKDDSSLLSRIRELLQVPSAGGRASHTGLCGNGREGLVSGLPHRGGGQAPEVRNRQAAARPMATGMPSGIKHLFKTKRIISGVLIVSVTVLYLQEPIK